MRKLGFVFLLLSLVALANTATATDTCKPYPWQSIQGYITTYLNDCPYLHSINRQNLESQAEAGCEWGLYATVYRELGCTTDASGKTTASGRLDYQCDCTDL